MRTLILTSIAVLALSGGAMAQMTTSTTAPMKSTAMTKKETKKEKKAEAKAAAMTPAPAAAAKPPMAVTKPMMPAAKPAMATTRPMMPTAKPAMSTAAKPAMATEASTPSAGGRKPMTPESKACSAQADTKGLHGKDREKFRRACLKGSK